MGYLLNGIKYSLHGLAFANNVVKTISVFQRMDKTTVFLQDAVGANCFGYNLLQGLVLKGFQDEVDRPQLHGLYGLFDSAVSRHHDNRQVRDNFLDPPEKLNAVHRRHLHVCQHQIKVCGFHNLQGMLGIVRSQSLIPFF